MNLNINGKHKQFHAMERLCAQTDGFYSLKYCTSLSCMGRVQPSLLYEKQPEVPDGLLFFFFLNKKTASGQPQCRELCWTQRTTLRSQPGIQASQHILFRLSSLPLFFRAECLSFLLLAPASPRSSETGKPAAMQFGFLHWTSCPG